MLIYLLDIKRPLNDIHLFISPSFLPLSDGCVFVLLKLLYKPPPPPYLLYCCCCYLESILRCARGWKSFTVHRSKEPSLVYTKRSRQLLASTSHSHLNSTIVMQGISLYHARRGWRRSKRYNLHTHSANTELTHRTLRGWYTVAL